MSVSYKDAYSILLEAQEKLNEQDISLLPKNQRLALLVAQRDIYLEIQALQTRKMKDRSELYVALTRGFEQSEARFQVIQSWAESAAKTGKIVDGLLKGLSLVLTLL